MSFTEINIIYLSMLVYYILISPNILNQIFVIPRIYNQLKKNKVISVNNANSSIDFLHAKQVIKIIYKIMKLKKPNTFIISSGKNSNKKNLYNFR